MEKKQNINTGADSNITPFEKVMLDETFQRDGSSEDDNNLTRSELDNTDEDGELLNEEGSADDVSGRDLDIPGADDDDDDNEDIGEEDEENNGYSVADTE